MKKALSKKQRGGSSISALTINQTKKPAAKSYKRNTRSGVETFLGVPSVQEQEEKVRKEAADKRKKTEMEEKRKVLPNTLKNREASRKSAELRAAYFRNQPKQKMGGPVRKRK